MHEIFECPVMQRQPRNHHRLAGIAQVLPLGADEVERHLEAIGQTGQHDGADAADVKACRWGLRHGEREIRLVSARARLPPQSRAHCG